MDVLIAVLIVLALLLVRFGVPMLCTLGYGKACEFMCKHFGTENPEPDSPATN